MRVRNTEIIRRRKVGEMESLKAGMEFEGRPELSHMLWEHSVGLVSRLLLKWHQHLRKCSSGKPGHPLKVSSPKG